MKKRWVVTCAFLVFFLAFIGVSVRRIQQVNSEYDLKIRQAVMEEPVYLNGYKAQVNTALIYTLDQYYQEHPQVEKYRAMNEGVYQYVLLVYLEVTKIDESAGELDLLNFVFRMDDGFTMFQSGEMVDLNGWTEAQVLEVNEPLHVAIPYYFAEDMLPLRHRDHVQDVEYKLTWGVYPIRNEILLDHISNWENTLGKAESLPEVTEEAAASGVEEYAEMLEEAGITTDNIKEPGETVEYMNVIYEINSAKFIDNVSQIPDYSESYQPQPEWMKPGAAMPEYTEEWDYRGDFIRKHNYLLLEMTLTNNSSEEQAPNMTGCRLCYERGGEYTNIWLADEADYMTGGAIEYHDSYADYVVLQPGEAKKIYILYDVSFDIDPTGVNKYDKLGYPTAFFTEEEADVTLYTPYYFLIEGPGGGDLSFDNVSNIFMKIDLEDMQ